jgi:hypothetical protein
MTQSNDETALFGERALGSAFSMAHETTSFRLHRTASFGKRRYWEFLWSKTTSSRAVPSFLSETLSSAAGGIIIFLFLSSASSSYSRSDFSSEIFSSSSGSSSSGSSSSGSSSSRSSSSHGRGYE